MLVEITGKYALFTRPELKVERVSYDVMTNAAAIGILRTVYWKPEMEYVINKIHVINKPRYETIMTNAQTGTIKESDIEKDYKNKKYLAVDRRTRATPRTERVLKDVRYIIDFNIRLTGERTPDNTVKKHEEIFLRRVRKGQCHEEPCLGVREFPCSIRLVDEAPASEIKGHKELGVMYHHMEYGNGAPYPVFFEAVMDNGIVDMDITKAPRLGSSHHGWFFKELLNHYEAMKDTYSLPVQGFSHEKITYEAVIDDSGKLLSFSPVLVNEKGKVVPVMMTVPEMVKNRTSGIKANFLYDNAKYVFGLDEKNGEEKKSAYRAKIDDVMGDIKLAETDALKKFLKRDKAEYLSLIGSVIAKPDGNIVFSYKERGCYIHELEPVKKAWADYYRSHMTGKKGICIVTGKEDIIAESHPLCKGVAGASTFAKMVSVDKSSPAFFSYGKSGLENSPFGEYAVYAYSTMLGFLLADARHRVSLGDTTFVFWTDTDNEELLRNIKMLLTGIKDDEETGTGDIPPGEHFYIAGLKGNSSRLFIPYYQEFVYGESRKEIEEFCLSIKGLYKDIRLTQNWDYIAGWEEKEYMENNGQAYCLGKLFAILEKAQRDAVPSTRVNKTIADKYIDRAGRCPSSVFPKLLADSVHHTNKVDYGSSRKIQKCLEELEAFRPAIPDRLSQAEQGDFYIGYYQMKRTFYKKNGIAEDAGKEE